MLRLEGVESGYGSIEVLRGISMHVEAGEIVTIIGGNGAGKTTTLMTICGVVRARAGRVLFEDRDITAEPTHKTVTSGLVQVPEGRKIFTRLSVLENLEIGAYTCRDKARIASNMERVFALFPILAERRAQSGGTLSGGEQQMLAIGRAMMAEPRLLLCDEPSLGLAPLIVKRIFDVLIELNRAGTTILLVEQNALAALKIAHRGYVLETGRVVMEGRGADLLEDPRVRAAYLAE